MKLPKSLEMWARVLFFLVFGLNAFVKIPYVDLVLGVLAIAVAVLTIFPFKLPKSLGTWCAVLFFGFYGASVFLPIPYAPIITGVLAIGVALFTILGK